MIKNSLPGRERGDWHRRRGIKINLLWLAHKLTRRRRHIFRITAAVRADITIDVITDRKIATASPVRRSDGLVPWRARTAAANRLHSPCDLAAENQRQLQPEQLPDAVANFPIDRIHRRCL